MPATDALQQLSEAITAIIDADSVVAAITGRTSDSIVRWRRRKAVDMPRLAYIAGPTDVAGGLGETYEVPLLIRGEAPNAALANALVRAAVLALTTQAFDAQACDAVVLEATYDDPQSDEGDASSDATAAAAEADCTILITIP
jgi:hypothetical protein